MSASVTTKPFRCDQSRVSVFGTGKKVLRASGSGWGRNGVASQAVKDITKDRLQALLPTDDDEELFRERQRVPKAEDVHADALHVTEPEAMGKLTKKAPVLSGSIKGMVMLNLGALLFGSNMVVIKWVEEMMTPEALNALRFGTAALCFLPWLPGALRNSKMLKPALELGIWLAAGYTAQAYGLSQTSAAHGAFTGTFTVLAVPILVGLSGRRIANRTWFAACAGLAGVSLLTTSGGDPNWGDLWCILSATLFGVHKWRSETVTTDFSASTTELVAAQLFVLAAATTCLAVPELADFVAASGWGGVVHSAASMPWLAILFMGVGTTALTLWIEMDALKEVSAPLAALIYTAEPLWGASFAWVLLDERWGAQGWLGAAIILGASLLSQLGGDPAEKAHGHADALQDSPSVDESKIRAHYEDF